jgi:hypothetical protein
MELAAIKTRFAALVCALAMVSFSGTALADSGSSDDGEQERTYLVYIQMNGSLVTVNMGETEIEQRCEQDNEFSNNNTQICTIALGS